MDDLVTIYEEYVNNRQWANQDEFKPYDRLLGHMKHS
jgi:hypothetical protein